MSQSPESSPLTPLPSDDEELMTSAFSHAADYGQRQAPSATSLVPPVVADPFQDAITAQQPSDDMHRDKRTRLDTPELPIAAHVVSLDNAEPPVAPSPKVNKDATDIANTQRDGARPPASILLGTSRSVSRHIDVLLESALHSSREDVNEHDDLDGVDMTMFDCPPSSDPTPVVTNSPIHNNGRLRPHDTVLRLDPIPDEQAEAAVTDNRPSSVGADDSGFFELDKPGALLHSDGLVLPDVLAAAAELDEDDFDDEWWNNVPEEALDVDDLTGFGTTQVRLQTSDEVTPAAECETSVQTVGYNRQREDVDLTQGGSQDQHDALDEAQAARDAAFFQSRGMELTTESGFQCFARGKSTAFKVSEESLNRSKAILAATPPRNKREYNLNKYAQEFTCEPQAAEPPALNKIFSKGPADKDNLAPQQEQLVPQLLKLSSPRFRSAGAISEAASPTAQYAGRRSPLSELAEPHQKPISPPGASKTQPQSSYLESATPQALRRPLGMRPAASASTPLRPLAFAVARQSTFKSPRPSTAVSSAPQQPAKASPALRRLNLGMTPRRRDSDSPVHRFVSPFKNGRRPEGLTATGSLVAMSSPRQLPSFSVSGPKARARPKIDNSRAIFDINPHGERFHLSSSGLRPQLHGASLYRQWSVPESVLSTTLQTAHKTTMPCGSDVEAAFQSLKNCVQPEKCHVNLDWVKNHWSMILWKLSSYIKTRPDLYKSQWHFEFVLDQLKYRRVPLKYEREIHRAERSSVKRIMERDSAAARPMVLCVSRILQAATSEDDSDYDDRKAVSGLELTDGWYRIRSSVDAALQGACERRKIVVGSKIVIVGARLERNVQESSLNALEGRDALEGFDSQSLSICGNSTTLAPWHARLGFTDQSFVASLGSLTSSGGVVAQLEVIVDRLFPYGFVNTSKESKESGAWNEAEEKVKADEWIRARERASSRLLDRSNSHRGDVAQLLRDAFDSAAFEPPASPDTQSSDEAPQDVLERLESSNNKKAFVKRLTNRQLFDLLQIVNEQPLDASFNDSTSFEKALDAECPPRQVRNFRVVRIRDARPLSESKPARQAQLTVWDAKLFEDDFLKEGRRYLVSDDVWIRDDHDRF
ncbi:hypothetical protein OIO90_000515 [Microbotryomycetes sp. JL221]|nr:hypothetical protein OIO90_000515 [Microbotryomycetes sp. JL221]